ncbi:hypothetical protein [Streptomyces sp. NPDC056628]|uniref:hypothetical protein n=1 Tax=Streptomyces sp. NPDC056628 TaxID=3345882 RepID=UPI00369065A6
MEAPHTEPEDRLTAGDAADGRPAEPRRVAPATYDVCLDHPQTVPLPARKNRAEPAVSNPVPSNSASPRSW